MLVKFRMCSNSFEAELLKGRLESEGIACVISGENINSLYGGIGALAIEVFVEEEDLERAKAVCDEA